MGNATHYVCIELRVVLHHAEHYGVVVARCITNIIRKPSLIKQNMRKYKTLPLFLYEIGCNFIFSGDLRLIIESELQDLGYKSSILTNGWTRVPQVFHQNKQGKSARKLNIMC